MGIFNKKFDRKDAPINSNQDFWNWFIKYEKTFHKVVKSGKNVEKDFFQHLSEKLNELRKGYFFLTGMYDEQTAELIITADGAIERIVFVEELVAAFGARNEAYYIKYYSKKGFEGEAWKHETIILNPYLLILTLKRLSF